MNIYEIDAAIMNCVNEDGEVIDTELMDQLQMQRNEKIENVALWIKNLQSDVDAFKAEEKNLAERRRTAENKIESLRGYLASALNGSKFQTTKCSVSFRKSKSVDIFDYDMIPPEYLKVETTVKKKDIADAMKSGIAVPGAVFKENTSMIVR